MVDRKNGGDEMNREKVITDWFQQYSDSVYHYLLYRVGPTEAEDLVQEVFIRALKGVHSFEGGSHPKTWLISIARHVVIDEYRKKEHKTRKKMAPFRTTDEPKTLDTPDTLFLEKEETIELYQAIQSLKPKYRDVIILRGIQDLTVRETASVLKWSESKVRITFFRAKSALKKCLNRRFEK
ncbi:RNA polymerase sigma factor [Evansella sp. AB-P1]|uniref:RNA polymerase sigma factor n=1 Tax=Evansella sp. AB-P1 TaxID=3037653 RepID=UPI00241E136E|nr:RNA polymerase sigma factor [Evansella sp. AB-P1]MDG5785997.1 RNA polymerase sigma factor [Evansella sp. AB-P1]